jgi:hypothetical protein
MRRLMLALAVTAVFGLALAAPAAAAPEQNPGAFTGTLTCGSHTFDMISTGFVAWPVDGTAGTPPALALGGTLTIYDANDQVVDTFTVAVPPGLVDKAQTCRFERQAGDTLRVWDPFYVLWPSN